VFNTSQVSEDFYSSLMDKKISPKLVNLSLGTGIDNDVLAIDKYLFDNY